MMCDVVREFLKNSFLFHPAATQVPGASLRHFSKTKQKRMKENLKIQEKLFSRRQIRTFDITGNLL